MKTSGFHASTPGGKKIFAVSIIVALILASFSAIGVLLPQAGRARVNRQAFRGVSFAS